MLKITMSIVTAAMLATTTSAGTLYSADFTGAMQGFTHTGSGSKTKAELEAITGPSPLTVNPASDGQFTIGFLRDGSGTIATDGSENFFRTSGPGTFSLQSSDFGGDHYFLSRTIDVSGVDSVDIDVVADFLGIDSFNNSPTEFIEYFYTLDGGAEQQFFYFTDAPNGSNLNASTSVDVNGISAMTVGLNANVSGTGDGFEVFSYMVDSDEPTPPTPTPTTPPVNFSGILLQYDTQNLNAIPPVTENAAISADDLTPGSGITLNASGDFNFRGWGPGTSSAADAIADGDYFQWGFDVINTVEVDLDSFDSRWDRSSTGPNQFEIFASVNDGPQISLLKHDFGDSSAGEDFYSVDLSTIPTLVQGDSLVFTLAAFGEDSGGGSAAGTFDLEELTDNDDGIVIRGSVTATIPSPTAVFFGISGLAITACRRRHRA